MYIVVPIQQGTHIIEYITFGVLLCVTHLDHLAVPTIALPLKCYTSLTRQIRAYKRQYAGTSKGRLLANT
jgi:hypothetical protein